MLIINNVHTFTEEENRTEHKILRLVALISTLPEGEVHWASQ